MAASATKMGLQHEAPPQGVGGFLRAMPLIADPRQKTLHLDTGKGRFTVRSFCTPLQILSQPGNLIQILTTAFQVADGSVFPQLF